MLLGGSDAGAHLDLITTYDWCTAFFAMNREKATQVMLKVHREGMGICGVYPRDVASTKVEQVATYARKHQHPLQCVMEEN